MGGWGVGGGEGRSLAVESRRPGTPGLVRLEITLARPRGLLHSTPFLVRSRSSRRALVQQHERTADSTARATFRTLVI